MQSFTYTEMKEPLSFSPKAFSFLLASFLRWPLAFFFFLVSFAAASGIDKRLHYISYEATHTTFKRVKTTKQTRITCTQGSSLDYLCLRVSFCGSAEGRLFSWALQVQVLFLHSGSPQAQSGFLPLCLFGARPRQAQQFLPLSPHQISSSSPFCSSPPEAPPGPTVHSAGRERPRNSKLTWSPKDKTVQVLR